MRTVCLIFILMLHRGAMAGESKLPVQSIPTPFETVIEERRAKAPSFDTRVSDEPGKLLSGKGSTKTVLEAIPTVPTQNFRQLLSKTPGLLTSEVANQSFASISYRGLGNPHEGYNILMLQDGLPISPDMYGYPANYYIPSTDALVATEFIRGGASLLYGPQPGGALNFVTRAPRLNQQTESRLSLRGGSRNFLSASGEVSSSVGNTAVLGSIQHRGSDGFRTAHSQFSVTNANLKTDTLLGADTHVMVEGGYSLGEFEEAGGVATQPGTGLVALDDPYRNTLSSDRLNLQRSYANVGLAHHFSDRSSVLVRLFGSITDRNSYRQNLGTATQFGGIPNSDTNTIQIQSFRQLGLDARFETKADLFAGEVTWTAGALGYTVDSPFVQQLGAAGNASTGSTQKDIDRKTRVASLFSEARFSWGDFSFTPGVRVENIDQRIVEVENVGATVPLRSSRSFVIKPLFGGGLEYKLDRENALYGNVSQGYKPVTFQDTIPLRVGDGVSEDIRASNTVTSEVGVRGADGDAWTYDLSGFYITYDNQFGRVGNVLQNTGGARHFGVNAATEFDVSTVLDRISGTSIRKDLGALHLFGNVQALNAQFDQGPLRGNRPQYAPAYMVRSGLVYYPEPTTKIMFLNTFVSRHFGDDGNSGNFVIPAYRVWDLTAEVEVIQNRLSVVGGLYNVFNSFYWSRVRSNGIEPADPRNFYLGVTGRI
jgi:Fe(3+) dicitrate transport protein